MNELKIETLEWFTIFVKCRNWAPTVDVKNLKEPGEQDCSSHEDSNNTDMEPENDIPIEN